MKKVTKSLDVELVYRVGASDPEAGHFAGGVEDPKHLDELAVWADYDEQFDFDRDAFVPSKDLQVQISGSRRALFEFGRYLIALSQLQTADPDYHDHFDELQLVNGKPACKLIVRLRDD